MNKIKTIFYILIAIFFVLGCSDKEEQKQPDELETMNTLLESR
jgi:PBP1b-binding outer membrane lipoprotein LpoB